MSVFHVTLTQGRADTLYLYASSKTKVLNFLNSVSTAVVRSIKEVVWSMEFKIATSGSLPSIPPPLVPSWHRVIFEVYSATYSKTYTLFGVPKTATLKGFELMFKNRLYIKGELILGIRNFYTYENASIDTDTTNLYQVQYVNGSKTYVEDFYALSDNSLRNMFSYLKLGTVTEVRKVVHLDSTIKPDDGNYLKRMGAYIADDSSYISFSIPKIKKNLNQTDIKNFIVSNLDFHNAKKIESDNIKLTTR